MELPNIDDVVELVRRDVYAGLAGLDHEGNRLDLADMRPGNGVPIFEPRPPGGDDPRGEFEGVALTAPGADVEVVEWIFRGAHVGDFPGARQTNKAVVIEGVTIVERGQREAPIRRYVDWSRVMAQLGVSATFRPEVDSLEGIPGFATDRE